MNEKEMKLLQDYVKKRFNEVDKDYKTFDLLIDDTLTYIEQKNILDKELETLLPAVIPKLKRECSIEEQKVKEQQEEMIKVEQEKQEAEIKARFEKELENITKDSAELEKLYYYPIQYIEMVANKNAKGLLLYGETSLGKSYRVKEVLKRLGKKDYLFVSGHITPMKFYSKMYQAKDDLVIFDDVDILNNIIILNMIKAGLNENSGNVVEYHTSKKMDIPSSFVFNGQMIILLNAIPEKNEHLKAIESRILKYNLKFTREEILKIIFEIAHKKEIENTTTKERIEVAKFLRDNTNRATKNLNIRLYLQAIDFLRWNKEDWKGLTLQQIQNDEYSTLIIEGCGKDKWVEETGLSVSTYKRLKKNLELTRAYGVGK